MLVLRDNDLGIVREDMGDASHGKRASRPRKT